MLTVLRQVPSAQTVWDVAPASLNVYQIEITGRCNAQCMYCPREQRKDVGHMTLETFAQALAVCKNKVVGLHHFGEAFLHPSVFAFVEYATNLGFDVGFSTNGKLMTQEKLDRVARAGLKWLRLHTDPFGVRLSDYVVPAGLEMTEHAIDSDNGAPRKEKITWSGQVDLGFEQGARKRECSFLSHQWRTIIWDGTIGLCCHDLFASQDETLCEKCDGYVFKDPRTFGDYDGLGST